MQDRLVDGWIPKTKNKTGYVVVFHPEWNPKTFISLGWVYETEADANLAGRNKMPGAYWVWPYPDPLGRETLLHCAHDCRHKTFSNVKVWQATACKDCLDADSPPEWLPTFKCAACHVTIRSYSPCLECASMLCKMCGPNLPVQHCGAHRTVQ